MRAERVHLEALGYELGPIVVTSAELEERLRPLYQRLRIGEGQLEALTGIVERRFWPPNTPLWKGATEAARRAIARSSVSPRDIEVVIYAGVCRDGFEPATACRVAHELGTSPRAAVYDLSNACLGVLNGILDIANRIELRQISAGLVVSSETSREIVEATITQMLAEGSMERFRGSLATLTGGSGAVAVLLTDGSFGPHRPRLRGGVTETAPEFHALCRWGIEAGPDGLRPVMHTDSVAVLQHGVVLGARTFRALLTEVAWAREDIDRVVCHQVGVAHQREILRRLEIPEAKDFTTFAHLGNMGTVSLPLTAAIAEERGFIARGQRVAFLGIGSGLNCLMLGWEW